MIIEALKALIAERGYVSIDQFMSLVITYYYANNQPFGKAGDFVTAPEVSQMFGESIAVWIAHTVIESGYQNFNILELGPGNGTLAYDVLNTLNKLQSLKGRLVKYYLYESSENLIQTQREKLKGYNVKWITNFDEELNVVPLFIIANEFLDALPITQLVKKEGKLYEMGITYDEGFSTVIGREMPDLSEYQDFVPESGILEIPSAAITLIKEMLASLGTISDVHLLFIDYGYLEFKYTSTLQALHKHKFVNPLTKIGEADVTALVNFPSISNALQNLGFAVDIITQGDFLRSMGIQERAELLSKNNPKLRAQIERDLNRLIAKDQMGELFKVLIAKPLAP